MQQRWEDLAKLVEEQSKGMRPQQWEVPESIGRWGEKAYAGAEQSYDTALSAMLQRIAPGIAGKGMWTSPGIREALRIEAGKPLLAARKEREMGIDAQMARMTTQSQQGWESRELQKLLAMLQYKMHGEQMSSQEKQAMWGGIGNIGGNLAMLPFLL